jgi:methylglyoxal synthase
MAYKKITMAARKNIALIAHDNRKQDLLEWVKYNKDSLKRHKLFATGTTGLLVNKEVGIDVTRFKSGPLGGDQQIGAKIADNTIDFMIFLWDPMEPHPHDPDVKALLRLSVVWNIPVACNRATADFLISSPLMSEPYERLLVDYEALREESIAGSYEGSKFRL